MSEQTPKPTPVIDPAKAVLNKRLETAFWDSSSSCSAASSC